MTTGTRWHIPSPMSQLGHVWSGSGFSRPLRNGSHLTCHRIYARHDAAPQSRKRNMKRIHKTQDKRSECRIACETLNLIIRVLCVHIIVFSILHFLMGVAMQWSFSFQTACVVVYFIFIFLYIRFALPIIVRLVERRLQMLGENRAIPSDGKNESNSEWLCTLNKLIRKRAKT